MSISEKKMRIVIDNYFKCECNVNTSIKEAFEKGFRIGVEKGLYTNPQKVGKWINTRIRISSGDFIRGVKCSKCGYETVVDDFKYCPNCGNPKMEEGE